jgi:hypothetical protein
MTTTQTAPNAAPENVSPTGAPNQYHLHAHGIQISYYPDGAGPLTTDGPIILAYQDTDYSATFRGGQAHVVAVEGLGTCVTVTLHFTADVGSRTATVLIPTVVLGAQTSAPVHTELIRTVHNSTFAGIGHPQRDHYTVTSLTGQASRGQLPL